MQVKFCDSVCKKTAGKIQLHIVPENCAQVGGCSKTDILSALGQQLRMFEKWEPEN